MTGHFLFYCANSDGAYKIKKESQSLKSGPRLRRDPIIAFWSLPLPEQPLSRSAAQPLSRSRSIRRSPAAFINGGQSRCRYALAVAASKAKASALDLAG